jgi:hypothetical protein
LRSTTPVSPAPSASPNATIVATTRASVGPAQSPADEGDATEGADGAGGEEEGGEAGS